MFLRIFKLTKFLSASIHWWERTSMQYPCLWVLYRCIRMHKLEIKNLRRSYRVKEVTCSQKWHSNHAFFLSQSQSKNNLGNMERAYGPGERKPITLKENFFYTWESWSNYAPDQKNMRRRWKHSNREADRLPIASVQGRETRLSNTTALIKPLATYRMFTFLHLFMR